MSELQEGPTERLVAVFHVPLRVEHLARLVEALQDAVGEVLYIRGPGVEVWSKGEPYGAEPDETLVKGYLAP